MEKAQPHILRRTAIASGALAVGLSLSGCGGSGGQVLARNADNLIASEIAERALQRAAQKAASQADTAPVLLDNGVYLQVTADGTLYYKTVLTGEEQVPISMQQRVIRTEAANDDAIITETEIDRIECIAESLDQSETITTNLIYGYSVLQVGPTGQWFEDVYDDLSEGVAESLEAPSPCSLVLTSLSAPS